jgi:SagB-type dehydrogenase family enzyme
MDLKPMILPEPTSHGTVSLEEAITMRESVRQYASKPLSTDQVGQILWAAQGLRGSSSRRNAPSAGGLNPLELYLVSEEGVFRYIPAGHRLEPHLAGDLRVALSSAALGQEFIAEAPATLLLTAVFSRIEVKYGKERSPQYIYLEAGHAAQNILLQTTALGLGGVPVGAFYEYQVSEVLELPVGHYPLYLIPIGYER